MRCENDFSELRALQGAGELDQRPDTGRFLPMPTGPPLNIVQAFDAPSTFTRADLRHFQHSQSHTIKGQRPMHNVPIRAFWEACSTSCSFQLPSSFYITCICISRGTDASRRRLSKAAPLRCNGRLLWCGEIPACISPPQSSGGSEAVETQSI